MQHLLLNKLSQNLKYRKQDDKSSGMFSGFSSLLGFPKNFLSSTYRISPSATKNYLTKFYHINSEFDAFSTSSMVLKILSEKLADKKYMYDDYKLTSIDFLSYFCLVEYRSLEQAFKNAENQKNAKINTVSYFQEAHKLK